MYRPHAMMYTQDLHMVMNIVQKIAKQHSYLRAYALPEFLNCHDYKMTVDENDYKMTVHENEAACEHFPRSGTRQLYVATIVHAIGLVAENDFALAREML